MAVLYFFIICFSTIVNDDPTTFLIQVLFILEEGAPVSTRNRTVPPSPWKLITGLPSSIVRENFFLFFPCLYSSVDSSTTCSCARISSLVADFRFSLFAFVLTQDTNSSAAMRTHKTCNTFFIFTSFLLEHIKR